MSRTFAFRIAAFLSVSVALVSFRFLLQGLDAAFTGMEGHIADRRTAFLIHIIASPVALAAGVLQFLPRLRAWRPALHRWTGRLYALAILCGGLAGLVMALDTAGGPVAGWGFGLLAILWMGATAQAVRLAMTGQIARHREWMIRSFALTFAAVTLRLEMPVFFIAGMDYAEASRWLAWMCWLPNLVVAEALLNLRSAQARLA
jgi:uncharacterized membrane protein